MSPLSMAGTLFKCFMDIHRQTLAIVDQNHWPILPTLPPTIHYSDIAFGEYGVLLFICNWCNDAGDIW